MNRSKQRTALVTGAGSGLGRAIAEALAEEGWNIAIADVDGEASRETRQRVRSLGGSGVVLDLDVTQPDRWVAARDELQREWDHLDLLVNNAGVGGSGEIGVFSLEDWRWLLDVNLFGAIHGCHTMVEWLKSNPRGAHIINTGSFAGIASAPAMAAYNVAKAGMISLSETLYTELKPHRIGVTVLCPVFFQTNLLNDGRFDRESERKIAAHYMGKAPFSADDVARAAIRGMNRRRLYVILDRKARIYWRLKRLIPMTFLKIVSFGYRRKLARTERNTD